MDYLGMEGCEARTAARTPVFGVCSSTSGRNSSSDFNLLRTGLGGGARGVVPLLYPTRETSILSDIHA